MGISQIKDGVTLATMGLVAFVAFRLYSLGKTAGEGIVDGAAQLYADLTTPDVVRPVLRLQSRYFYANGNLKEDAREVIRSGWPDFYVRAFIGLRIKPDYSYLIDSGIPIINDDYK